MTSLPYLFSILSAQTTILFLHYLRSTLLRWNNEVGRVDGPTKEHIAEASEADSSETKDLGVSDRQSLV